MVIFGKFSVLCTCHRERERSTYYSEVCTVCTSQVLTLLLTNFDCMPLLGVSTVGHSVVVTVHCDECFHFDGLSLFFFPQTAKSYCATSTDDLRDVVECVASSFPQAPIVGIVV